MGGIYSEDDQLSLHVQREVLQCHRLDLMPLRWFIVQLFSSALPCSNAIKPTACKEPAFPRISTLSYVQLSCVKLLQSSPCSSCDLCFPKPFPQGLTDPASPELAAGLPLGSSQLHQETDDGTQTGIENPRLRGVDDLARKESATGGWRPRGNYKRCLLKFTQKGEG